MIALNSSKFIGICSLTRVRCNQLPPRNAFPGRAARKRCQYDGNHDQLYRRRQRRMMSDSPDSSAADTTTLAKQLEGVAKEPKSLREFSSSLTQNQKKLLQSVFSGNKATPGALAEPTVPIPSNRDLRLVALQTSIPFVAFGFMDNAILIVAGDAIDTSLGVALGISTMCAAAIGNIVSDVAGVLLGTAVEDFCAEYLKVPVPDLSTAQRQLRHVRFAQQAGTAAGLVIGCIVGMFPLLFIDPSKVQAKKRAAAMNAMFRDVVSEVGSLVGAQRTRLFIVCNKPVKKEDKSSQEADRQHVVPTAEGDYLYAKYSEYVRDAGDDEANEDSLRITDRNTDRWIPLGRGIVSRAALTGEAWKIDNVASEPDYIRDEAASPSRLPRNMLCVPVLDGNGNSIAVIQAIDKVGRIDPKEGAGFTQKDVQILQAVASHVSVSLQRMYLEDGANEEEMRLKDTIRILKDSGLTQLRESEDALKRSPTRLFGPSAPSEPLFPED